MKLGVNHSTYKQLGTLAWAKVFIPPSVAAIYLGVPFFFGYEKAADLFYLLVAYVFPPLGKESVIPLGISFGIDPYLLGGSITLIDLMAAVFIYWNYDMLSKIPKVRDVLQKIESKSQRIIQKRKWISGSRWLGLTAFMIIPFKGSGATDTTIIGRILGIKRKMIFVVLAGSVISSSAVTITSSAVISHFFG